MKDDSKQGVGADGNPVTLSDEQVAAFQQAQGAVAAQEGKHPAHAKLDELEALLNTLGSYVTGVTANVINDIRALL